MHYRIVLRKNGKFVAQMRSHILWNDMFCGSVSDLPDEFDTVEEAERRIRERHAQMSNRPGVVKQFTL